MICVVTGSGGLVGSEASRFFAQQGFRVIGIDNDMRAKFFGPQGSVWANIESLRKELGDRYQHLDWDITTHRTYELFSILGSEIAVVIHTAGQPSHDWAAKDPLLDFRVNAQGTLNLLEAVRHHCPEAIFIYTSSNKVYGDRPNLIPYMEKETRWEPLEWGKYRDGFSESMSIDQCLHSPFGSSKLAADILVQEYGKYFGLKTVCFRCGCITGPAHQGVESHGFLSYLMKCTLEKREYTVFGYKGKQVRDNIHSRDLVEAFWRFVQVPGCGEVFNLGGGRASNCSILEAIQECEVISGNHLKWIYSPTPRKGDHIWWISDYSKFQAFYPGWQIHYDTHTILEDIFYETAIDYHSSPSS